MEALADVPRVVLGSWPTPIKRLARTSEMLGIDVYVKLESESGAWGGNKVRKLEYVLPSLDERAVVTHGAGTSSWAAAVAFHAASVAGEVHVGLAGRVPEDLDALYAGLGTIVHASPYLSALPVMAFRARVAAGRGAVALPTGGSGMPGDLGSMHAGLEIAASIAARDMPRPREVIVPAGSAGTAAGVAVALGLERVRVPVVAVRVAPRPLGTAALVRRRANRLIRSLVDRGAAREGAAPAPVIGDGRFLGPGYGRPTPESLAAIEIARRDGLELDPVYAAKAFAALLHRGRSAGGPLLFVHTSPGPPPPDVVRRGDVLPGDVPPRGPDPTKHRPPSA